MARLVKVQVTETRSTVLEVEVQDHDDDGVWEEKALAKFEGMNAGDKDWHCEQDSVIVIFLDSEKLEQDPDDARDEAIERRRLDDLDRGSNRYSALDNGDYD